MNIRHFPYSGAGILFLILLAVFLIPLTGSPEAAGDDFFERQYIDIPGRILGIRYGDFNADSLADIIVIADENIGGRIARVYLQRSSRRFPPSASQILQLPSTANMVDCVDLDGDNSCELIYMDRNGVHIFHADGEAFDTRARQAIIENTIFYGSIQGGIIGEPFIHTIDDALVAFVPMRDGFTLWKYEDGRFAPYSQINLSHDVRRLDRSIKQFGAGPVNLGFAMPSVAISDDNADQLDDIYLAWDDRIVIYHQKTAGKFDHAGKNDFYFQSSANGNLCLSQLIDYDRDGRLDLISSRSAGGISGSQTDIYFYGADRLRQGSRMIESHRISLTDACGNIMVDNIDRQGGLELVVPAVEVGVMSSVKMMLTKKTDFYFLIYPIDNLGRPASEPTVRHKLSCRLDFDLADPTAKIMYDWTGDYNGDGLPDLIFADGNDQLNFYLGSQNDYVSSRSDLVLNISNPEFIETTHLNDDGLSDLIIIHMPTSDGSRISLLVTTSVG